MTHKKNKNSLVIVLLTAVLCLPQPLFSNDSDESAQKKLSDAPRAYYPEPWVRSDTKVAEMDLERSKFQQMKPPETWVVLTVLSGVAVLMILIRFLFPRT